VDERRMRALFEQGLSVRAIARELGAPKSTVYDALKEKK